MMMAEGGMEAAHHALLHGIHPLRHLRHFVHHAATSHSNAAHSHHTSIVGEEGVVEWISPASRYSTASVTTTHGAATDTKFLSENSLEQVEWIRKLTTTGTMSMVVPEEGVGEGAITRRLRCSRCSGPIPSSPSSCECRTTAGGHICAA